MFWSDLAANLDLVLVPTGILFMVAYHLYLLYRIKKYPNTTVTGFENANKRVWVQQMMMVIIRTVITDFSYVFPRYIVYFFLVF